MHTIKGCILKLELRGNSKRSVIVEGSNVRIIKSAGLLSSAREKTIPIRQITSVEVKKPGVVYVGFIQFSIAGGVARDSTLSLTGGTFSAAQDENSVLFTGQENYEIALKIKDYIEKYSEALSQTQSTTSVSVADEISKLKRLLDDGVLTEAEYNKQKQQLLGS